MPLSNEGLFSSATSTAALFQIVRNYPVNQMRECVPAATSWAVGRPAWSPKTPLTMASGIV